MIEAKLNNDNLTINVVDLLGSLSGDQALQLIEQLSCSETVIKHVADQLLEGWTESGYHGDISSGLIPSTEICIARDKIAKGANDIANKRIAELEGLVKSAEKQGEAGWDAYRTLKDNYCM